MKLLLAVLILASSAAAECIPFDKAPENIGKTTCVTGKVMKVSQSPRSGTYFLNFCDDYRNCPFTVVVFPKDLRDVGDVTQLEGKTIEIHGTIKEYRGRAEIVLSDARQLKGESAKIPPAPKNLDVERRGNYSAGKFSHPDADNKRTRQTRPRPTTSGEQEPD